MQVYLLLVLFTHRVMLPDFGPGEKLWQVSLGLMDANRETGDRL
jgi:hypothetical protein